MVAGNFVRGGSEFYKIINRERKEKGTTHRPVRGGGSYRKGDLEGILSGPLPGGVGSHINELNATRVFWKG